MMIRGSKYMTKSDITTCPEEEPELLTVFLLLWRSLYFHGMNCYHYLLFYMLLLVWCCCTFWTLQDWRNPYHREGKIGNVILGFWFLVLVSVLCGYVWRAHSWPIFPKHSHPLPYCRDLFYYHFTGTGIRRYTESPGINDPDRCVFADDLTTIKTSFLIKEKCDIYTSLHDWSRPTFSGRFAFLSILKFDRTLLMKVPDESRNSFSCVGLEDWSGTALDVTHLPSLPGDPLVYLFFPLLMVLLCL